MRLSILQALPLALIACAAAYLAVIGSPEQLERPVEKPATVGEIDFDALRREASDALEALRHAHERRRQLAAIAEAS
jgi:hypothetical protein